MTILEMAEQAAFMMGVVLLIGVIGIKVTERRKKKSTSVEIERKFLVNPVFLPHVSNSTVIAQGYLNSDPERTVRVRLSGDEAFITIKGAGSESGMSRYEFERPIEVRDALELMELCEPGQIRKVRYYIPHGNHTYEVDVFEGDNEGLVIAEVELKSEGEKFSKPEWLGEEVTGRSEYYNSALAKRPFKSW